MNKRYEKIEQIGSGAQSIVYKVKDTEENNEMYIYLILYSFSLCFNFKLYIRF
jgi:hypothetical protein